MSYPLTSYHLTFEQTIEEIFADPYFQSLEGVGNQVNAILEFDTRKQLKRIHSPTLVVCGKEDIPITNNEAEALTDSATISMPIRLNGLIGLCWSF